VAHNASSSIGFIGKDIGNDHDISWLVSPPAAEALLMSIPIIASLTALDNAMGCFVDGEKYSGTCISP
jgi:hypothetical protein